MHCLAEKNLQISNLLDIYGELLTEKQRRLTSLYYEEDFSLSEIAENENITRQGARDFIKRSENQLFEYENVVKMLDFQDRINKLLSAIKNLCEKDESINNYLAKDILAIIDDYEG